MTTVDFIHRTSKPSNPIAGCFYWVDCDSGVQLFFAPNSNPDELELLTSKELYEKIASLEGDISLIEEELETPYSVEDTTLKLFK